MSWPTTRSKVAKPAAAAAALPALPGPRVRAAQAQARRRRRHLLSVVSRQLPQRAGRSGGERSCALKQQYVVVCAHYDHVGYGSRRNSNGPDRLHSQRRRRQRQRRGGAARTVGSGGRWRRPPRRSILFRPLGQRREWAERLEALDQQPHRAAARMSLRSTSTWSAGCVSDASTVYGTRTSTACGGS